MSNSLWLNNLEDWMDEEQVKLLFNNTPISVTYYQDSESRALLRTCKVEFPSAEAAANALITLSGQKTISGSPILLDVLADWEKPNYYMLFITNIDPDVTENEIKQLFQSYGCVSARVLRCMDSSSTSLAFVWLGSLEEAERAHVEMQGALCIKRPILVHSIRSDQNTYLNSPGFYGSPQPVNQFTDQNNTAIFISGLSPQIKSETLRSYFEHLGEVLHTQVFSGFAKIIFVQRHSAERAINEMNNFPILGQRIQISWSRPPSMSLLPAAQSTYWPALHAPIYPSWGTIPTHNFSPFTSVNRYAAKSLNQLTHPPLLPPGLKNGTDYPYLPIPPTLLNDKYLAEKEAVDSRLEADSSPLIPVHFS
ncbi:U1 snRNP-associated protein Usp109 [Schizosaccharomyces cryophilus OY26]|uniref:U1 snRNP-associated protein Usp109 n=1 Tax=Schizosaccharomyces cryophilus (strain OY26 / ATCC MYA-4695 / CBS 11777 / NBRC 106824 / NRRL Y48691) TaxID=653667 RepID=S9VVG1_SCHCR|nr:U1 snRNP-associated protein Usp109 [Schizosaccharomyces cryophilus OY26]EPY50149.1 U1 snRNP-associated protein Usp109 [Schizosaccharomyces cryophilus OY26]